MKLLFLITAIAGKLIYHQEFPDVWTTGEIRTIVEDETCIVGDCRGEKLSSHFDFSEIPETGLHCFRFVWDDTTHFSWCQTQNPIKKRDFNEQATEVYYSPGENAFSSSDIIRFSGLFLSNNKNTLFDGTKGNNMFFGVGFSRTYNEGYKNVQVRGLNADFGYSGGIPNESKSVDLLYQNTPFAPHGFKCDYTMNGRMLSRFRRQDDPVTINLNPYFACYGGNANEWSEWSVCSDSCDGGTRTRTRTCNDEFVECSESLEESKICNTESCELFNHDMTPCECEEGEFWCPYSSNKNLKCDNSEMCERVSMNPNESYRCVPHGMGECKSTGDPHVVTFDGAQMDVYSTGKYVLAQSNDLLEDVPDFRVILQTKIYTKVSETESVWVEFESFDTGTKYVYYANRNLTATMSVSTQFSNYTVALTDQANEAFTFKRFATRAYFATWFGLRVTVENRQQWAALFMALPLCYKEHLAGICGNYDFSKENDYTKPETLNPLGAISQIDCDEANTNGFKLAECERDTACGWMLEGDGCGITPAEVDEIIDECDKELACQNLFFPDWLVECHKLVDTTKFVADCKVDLCLALKPSLAKKEMLGSYVSECQKHMTSENSPALEDIVCNWEEKSGFPDTCGPNQVYKGF